MAFGTMNRPMFRTLPQRVGQNYGNSAPRTLEFRYGRDDNGVGITPLGMRPRGTAQNLPGPGMLGGLFGQPQGTVQNLPGPGVFGDGPITRESLLQRLVPGAGQIVQYAGNFGATPFPRGAGYMAPRTPSAPAQPQPQAAYNQPTQPSSGRFAATVTPQSGLRTGGVDPALVDPAALRQYQQQTDMARMQRDYQDQSRGITTDGFRYGADGRPMMPALTESEQATLNRNRQYDASSDPMGAMSSYDRFRPGGAFGSPAPTPQYQPTLLPNNTPVGTQTTIFNRDDGRQVGLTPNFRGTADDYQPIMTGDADTDRRRAAGARAGRQGTAFIGSRIVPREQNQGRSFGLPGYPDAVARSMTPEQRQQVLQAGVNTRRQHFGLPPVSGGTQAQTGQLPSPPTQRDEGGNVTGVAPLQSEEGRSWLESSMDRMTPEEFGKTMGTDANPYNRADYQAALDSLNNGLEGPARFIPFHPDRIRDDADRRRAEKLRDYLRSVLGEGGGDTAATPTASGPFSDPGAFGQIYPGGM